jgi:transposase InsO family protein
MLGKLEDKAKALGRSLKGALMHSDQGKLYKAGVYIKFMKRNGIERSMSNKGNCYDNSVIECFFGNLKTEIGDLDQYKTVQALIDRIEQYIKYYNERRIQLGLGGMSPVEYRKSKMRISVA